MEIDASNFHTWKKDPVTIVFLKRIEGLVVNLKSSLTDPQVLMGNQKHIARLLGNIEALAMVLNVKADDLLEDKKEESNIVTPESDIIIPGGK